ncbi:hypothetical protein L1N85_10905 [Paenibacillus alkaliterrae]|uniref:hypothetical protein n=1 Tax=Paenibacillus alkaliterrae TaxID=320909 RepID=UPI001F2AD86E|nr:hypothetical protein [Paenibacillus alkaliterrae]MCF2938945.1 hypothetical protein [Paenibacillus alkaliterrae]
MKHALYVTQQALKDYADASWHQRLNIMTEYFENELPVVVEEMKRKLEGEQ